MSIQQPLLFAPAPVVTWDTTVGNFSGTPILTNGNLTFVAGANPSISRATLGRSTGKYYFECVIDTPHVGTSGPQVGVTATAPPQSHSISGYWLQCSNAYVWHQGTSTPAGGSNFSAGDIFQMAIDFGAGNGWFGKNNAWFLSGNPSAGTSPAVTGISGTYYPVVEDTNTGGSGQTTARFALASFSYTPPTAFVAWAQ